MSKKLAPGFEVAKLEDEMSFRGVSVHRADARSFRCAQVKIELSIFCGEPRQPIQVVNFPLGQDR
jgi:hypothetical protein